MSQPSNIRFVLDRPTHPGNIGAAARAMMVMGLSALHLVAPRRFPDAEATAMAAGAADLLGDARIHASLDEALAGCRLVLGTSARLRALSQPQLDARAAAARISAEAANYPVAVLFGSEKRGLDNAAVGRCHFLVHIPCSEQYRSLNLAQAVQIVAYEIRLAGLTEHRPEIAPVDWEPEPAENMELFFTRLERTLTEIRFLNPDQPKRLMQRLRRLFLRARPDENELNILNGILTAAVEAARAHARPRDRSRGN